MDKISSLAFQKMPAYTISMTSSHVQITWYNLDPWPKQTRTSVRMTSGQRSTREGNLIPIWYTGYIKTTTRGMDSWTHGLTKLPKQKTGKQRQTLALIITAPDRAGRACVMNGLMPVWCLSVNSLMVCGDDRPDISRRVAAIMSSAGCRSDDRCVSVRMSGVPDACFLVFYVTTWEHV